MLVRFFNPFYTQNGCKRVHSSFVITGLADGDIDLADRLLQPCLLQYPKGALFLFFAGRVQEIRGQIDEVDISFVILDYL